MENILNQTITNVAITFQCTLTFGFDCKIILAYNVVMSRVMSSGFTVEKLIVWSK